MKHLTKTEQIVTVAIVSQDDGILYPATETIAKIIIIFLSSILLQTIAILLWRSAEFSAFQMQSFITDFSAGIEFISYLAGAFICWLFLKKIPYLGG